MTVDSDTGALAEPIAQEKVRCYFDVTLGGLPAGRIVFELFPGVAPKTCENFRALCTGEAGIGQKTGKSLHYKGIIFHRVVKDFMIQSGDFSNGNGTGGESIYGGTFDDEAFTLKHDRAFLLSMANRGKNTNGSQFFITTQPAPHLDNVHVVFGHVVSGQDLVRQLEQLPVDRNSRPLQDAMVSNCGELVRQIKVKKEKKNKKAAASSEDSEDETSRKRKKDKKKKRGKDSSPRTKRVPEADASIEEGELEDEMHPMATVTKIDPDEIPEVSNKYLMRSDATKRASVPEDDRKRDNRAKEGQRGFGWMKKNVPLSRSGRVIKGRGHFRYRTPSRSRSRSRSQTPIHWRAAQKRTIKMTDLEKLEDEKRQRESEIKRREAERKKRHEELAKGVSKKSFFELNQEQSVPAEKSTSESPEAGASSKRANEPAKAQQEEPVRGKSNGSIDMNALDYEHHPAGTSDTEPDEASHKKSDTLAKALGVEPKKKSNDSSKAADDRRKPADDRKRDRSRSRSRDRRRGDGYRGRSPPVHHRGGGGGGGGGGNRNRQPYGFSAAPHYNRFNQQQQATNRRYGGGNNVGGSYYSRPRGRFGGTNERYDRDRSRRSRSHDGGFSRRSRRDRSASHSRSRSPEHRRRRKDNSSTGSSQERDRDERSKRNRSVTPADRRSTPRPVLNDKVKREKTANGKELDKFRDKSPGSVATAIVVAATAAVEAAKLPATITIKSEQLSEEEKARMQKEKMLKRAETLLLLKSHMEKEIEEQQRKAREKQQQQLLLRKQKEEQEARALDAVMDLAQLKQLKKETIQKLNAQEAAQRILETVVTNVNAAAASASGAISQKKKSKGSSSKRRSSRSSSSSSSSSAASKKEKSRKKRKDKKRKARRHSSSSSS
uniref:peptidylprolyl isomerase n=1 Tax=Anopheles minimus TaxID=112268 RepID=A0A182VYL1_9DIPT